MVNFQTSGLNYWETVEDRWVYTARCFTSIESSFQPCEFTAIVPGVYTGEVNFQTSGLNYWETVEDRWIYTARRFTSIEFSFDPCDIYRDSPRGVPRGDQNVQKMC